MGGRPRSRLISFTDSSSGDLPNGILAQWGKDAGDYAGVLGLSDPSGKPVVDLAAPRLRTRCCGDIFDRGENHDPREAKLDAWQIRQSLFELPVVRVCSFIGDPIDLPLPEPIYQLPYGP